MPTTKTAAELTHAQLADRTMIVTATPDGVVTLENDVSRWGLLSLPVETHRHPYGHRVWTARAMWEIKSGEYTPRVVEIRLYADDVAAIYMALGPAA